VNVTTLQAMAEAWPAGMLLAVVLFGLAIGSFLNVVIVRVPEGRSLWHPRSACLGCSAQLAWHDNIPVLSFLWLRGRCRKCGMRISRRYPIVEAVTAAALAAAYLAFGPTGDFIVAAVLLAALVVALASPFVLGMPDARMARADRASFGWPGFLTSFSPSRARHPDFGQSIARP